MKTLLWIVLHAFLFLVAVVVFYLGLGVGLALNATLGTAIWAVAGIILLGNLVWIVLRLKSRGRGA